MSLCVVVFLCASLTFCAYACYTVVSECIHEFTIVKVCESICLVFVCVCVCVYVSVGAVNFRLILSLSLCDCACLCLFVFVCCVGV